VQVNKDDFAAVHEAEPVQSEEPSAGADSSTKKFSKFGFLYSKEGYTVEQELKSQYEDGIHSIMNCPIPDADGNMSTQTLGHEYDVVFLANCQSADAPKMQNEDFKDEPKVKRSSPLASVSSTYGVAVL